MTSYITDHCAWFERCRDNRLLLLHAPPATPLGAGQYLEACHCTSLAPVQKPVFAPGLTSPINSPIARRPSAEGYDKRDILDQLKSRGPAPATSDRASWRPRLQFVFDPRRRR